APPLAAMPYVVAVLVLIAFVLMGAANAPTNIKRLLRHPMLTGVIVWGIAHLLANGDNRSVVLFGGLSIWAVIEIFTISRRDGAWTKPATVPLAKEPILIGIGFVLFALVLYFHNFLFGVAAFASR
ncbi:MAG: NnrU family protein, partial [Pseudomonadales bacterium]